MNKQQLGLLQQALWRLESAKKLVELALVDNGLVSDIENIMQDIEANIAVNSENID